MIKRIVLSALLVSFLVADASAQSRFHRRRGAILGGVAGAAIGAAIGNKGHNEAAGALIGGAVGAVAGGTIGDQKDRRVREQNYRSQEVQQYRQQLSQQQEYANWQSQQLAQQQVARALSMDDVITMYRRGLSDETIIQYVRVNGVRHRLSVSDIISLHDQGVSEPIINAMQAAPVAYADSPPMIIGPDGHPVDAHGYQDPASNNLHPDRSYGPSIIVPPNPQPSAPLIDPTRPYIFPPAN